MNAAGERPQPRRSMASPAQLARGICLHCGPFALPIPSITVTLNEVVPRSSRVEYRCDAGHLTSYPIDTSRRETVALVRRYEFLGAHVVRITPGTVDAEVLEFDRWLFSGGPEGFDAARQRIRLSDTRRDQR